MISHISTYKLVNDLLILESNLNEGLILTHDIYDSIKILETILSKWFFHDISTSNNKINIILGDGFFNVDTFLEFQILITNLGYYVSSMEVTNNMNMSNILKIDDFKERYLDNDILKRFIKYNIKLEPKYDIKHTLKSNILYHVTEDKYLDRILKYGLVPKSKSTKTFHPDRIYFVYNIDDAQTYINSKNLFYKTNISLSKQPNRSKFKEIKFIILKVELPINNDIIFYDDPNFKGKGIYTYENIDKKFISIL